METRQFKKITGYSDKELPQQNNNPNGKRKNPNIFQTKKVKVSTEDVEEFRISYITPHSPFFGHQDIQNVSDFIMSTEEEEVLLKLYNYNKTLSFRALSHIRMHNYIDELYQKYQTEHTLLKAKNNTKRKPKILPTVSKEDIENHKISKAIYYCNLGQNKKKVAQILGIKYSQLLKCLRKQQIGKEPIIAKRGAKTKILFKYLDFLRNHLSNPKNGLTSLRALKKLLVQKFNLNNNQFSLGLVHKMIKKINFSRKKVQRQFERRNTQETIEKRYKIIQEIIKHKRLDRNFIYIDETGFNNYVIPIFGYSEIGKKLVYPVKPKTHNFSVLAAISEEGLIGYQVFNKGVKGQDFGAFIINLINSQNLQENGLNNYVFFMDNASIHKARCWKKLRDYIIVCFNAPYSPFLNPIEEFFGSWKFNFRLQKTIEESEISKNIVKACKNIGKRQIIGFVKHSISYYRDSLEKIKID